MAYTDDAVMAKLSSLNDQQDSIVTVAQWIMFHRRYADRTAQLWLERLKDASSSKRLALIYLANEVVQQSKARKKEEFVKAYTPLIAEATSVAYTGATLDLQNKIRRVMTVWRDRQIFEPSVQSEIESRVDQIDQSRGSGRKAQLGGSLFSPSQSSAAPELQPLLIAHASLTRAETLAGPSVTTAISEHDKLTASDTPKLAPPVQANRLGALLKQLAKAEDAVAESVKARKVLLEGLEKLMEDHRARLMTDEKKLADLTTRRTSTHHDKAKVENEIMLSMTGDGEPQRPKDEPLTPPPVESLTPVGSPREKPFVTTTGADIIQEQPMSSEEPPPPPVDQIPTVALTNLAGGRSLDDALQSVPIAKSPLNGDGPRIKKRRLGSHRHIDEEATFDLSMMGELDEDVTAMLG